jgi:hypothetical protein
LTGPGPARSGDRIALAAYLGKSDRFDQAIADFAEAYAEQNDRDYASFQETVRRGGAQAVRAAWDQPALVEGREDRTKSAWQRRRRPHRRGM